MQRQRQELSQAVRQLTENSNSLYQQIRPKDHLKKRLSSSWTETDLDSMSSINHHSLSASIESMHFGRAETNSSSTTPLYIDTGSLNSSINLSTSSKHNNSGNNKVMAFKSHESDGLESSGLDSDDLLETSAFGKTAFIFVHLHSVELIIEPLKSCFTANLSNPEKQEIKTVRIVKRESERRHRDRERGSVSLAVNSNQNLDQVLEEEAQFLDDYNRSKSLPRSYNDTHEAYLQNQSDLKMGKIPVNQIQSQRTPNSMFASSPSIPVNYTDYYNNVTNHYPVSMTDRQEHYGQRPNSHIAPPPPPPVAAPIKSTNPFSCYLDQPIVNGGGGSTQLRQKTESIQSLTKTIGDLSPVFQSEAARQIIIEMSGNTSEENNEKVPLAQKQRRAIPKEKRRHYTAPNTLNAKSMQEIQTENDMNKNVMFCCSFIR